MTIDGASLLLFAAIFNGLASLVIWLLGRPFIKKTKTLWLLALLIAVLLFLTEQFFRQTKLIDQFPFILFISTPVFFSFLPMIYCFQRKIREQKTRAAFHFIIPLAVLIIMFPTYRMPADEKLAMYYNPDVMDPPWIVIFYVLYWLVYIFFIFKYQRRYANALKAEQSDNSIEKDIFSNSLISIVGWFSLIFPLTISIQYLGLEQDLYNNLQKGLYLIFSMSAHFFLFIFLSNKEKIIPSIKISLPVEAALPKDLKGKMNFLSQKMEVDKLFLDPDLSLSVLAKKIGWSRTELSVIINKGFQKNFYDFINTMRVEEVIRKWNNKEHHNYSLDYIVKQAGFKSYTSFYRVFKKIKGLSPTQFLKSLNN